MPVSQSRQRKWIQQFHERWLERDLSVREGVDPRSKSRLLSDDVLITKTLAKLRPNYEREIPFQRRIWVTNQKLVKKIRIETIPKLRESKEIIWKYEELAKKEDKGLS